MRQFLLAAAVSFSVSLLLPSFATAQTFPTRPIQLVVPFAPGGPTDVIARTLADEFQKILGQPTIVENRTGAGGTIATQYVIKADASGYTQLLANSKTWLPARLIN